jgi:hypothetical protein
MNIQLSSCLFLEHRMIFLAPPMCAKKAKLSIVSSGTSYVIITPRGRVDVDRMVCKGPLDLAGWVI